MNESDTGALILRGGRVIDPIAGSDAVQDLAVSGSRIVAAGDAPSSAEILDVSGMMVVPGLIDYHVHVYEGVSHYGIDADTYCIERGVTTAIDAGSAGAQTFPGFQRFIISAAKTDILAFLNISTSGLLIPEVGELEDSRFLIAEKAIAVARQYPESIIGIKIRVGDPMTDSDPGKQLREAKAVARELNLPLMVHITDTLLPLDVVLEQMTAGDVITHCFHGKRGAVINEDGQVHSYVRDAIDRGVLLDIAHGRSSFSFDVARAALADGVAPHITSSDLHIYCADGPAFDLTTCMSKMLHVGMSFEDMLASVTSRPAAALGRADELGSLKAGTTADITVLESLEGRWEFKDAEGSTAVLEQLLVPRWVVKNGVATKLQPSVHER